MKDIREGEVWKVRFPLEEDEYKWLPRPVVVLDIDRFEVFSVKVTKHDPRDSDKYDTPIVFWEDAKLRCKSTARIRHTKFISRKQFISKYGDLHPDDFSNIQKRFKEYINEN
jgi:hypothetical protein